MTYEKSMWLVAKIVKMVREWEILHERLEVFWQLSLKWRRLCGWRGLVIFPVWVSVSSSGVGRLWPREFSEIPLS